MLTLAEHAGVPEEDRERLAREAWAWFDQRAEDVIYRRAYRVERVVVTVRLRHLGPLFATLFGPRPGPRPKP